MTGIQHTGDSRVVERGENLALQKETVMEGWLIAPVPQELDGGALLNFSVSALCQVDRTHPATAQKANQPVCSAAVPLSGFCRSI